MHLYTSNIKGHWWMKLEADEDRKECPSLTGCQKSWNIHNLSIEDSH